MASPQGLVVIKNEKDDDKVPIGKEEIALCEKGFLFDLIKRSYLKGERLFDSQPNFYGHRNAKKRRKWFRNRLQKWRSRPGSLRKALEKYGFDTDFALEEIDSEQGTIVSEQEAFSTPCHNHTPTPSVSSPVITPPRKRSSYSPSPLLSRSGSTLPQTKSTYSPVLDFTPSPQPHSRNDVFTIMQEQLHANREAIENAKEFMFDPEYPENNEGIFSQFFRDDVQKKSGLVRNGIWFVLACEKDKCLSGLISAKIVREGTAILFTKVKVPLGLIKFHEKFSENEKDVGTFNQQVFFSRRIAINSLLQNRSRWVEHLLMTFPPGWVVENTYTDTLPDGSMEPNFFPFEYETMISELDQIYEKAETSIVFWTVSIVEEHPRYSVVNKSGDMNSLVAKMREARISNQKGKGTPRGAASSQGRGNNYTGGGSGHVPRKSYHGHSHGDGGFYGQSNYYEGQGQPYRGDPRDYSNHYYNSTPRTAGRPHHSNYHEEATDFQQQRFGHDAQDNYKGPYANMNNGSDNTGHEGGDNGEENEMSVSNVSNVDGAPDDVNTSPLGKRNREDLFTAAWRASSTGSQASEIQFAGKQNGKHPKMDCRMSQHIKGYGSPPGLGSVGGPDPPSSDDNGLSSQPAEEAQIPGAETTKDLKDPTNGSKRSANIQAVDLSHHYSVTGAKSDIPVVQTMEDDASSLSKSVASNGTHGDEDLEDYADL